MDILGKIKTGAYVCACVFQREKDSAWEWGFDIDGKTVCDSNGLVVYSLWDVQDQMSYGMMCLPFVEK